MNSVGAVVLVVTAYPTIPLALSVAFILTLFVLAVASVTTGFSLSIVFTVFVAALPACPVLSNATAIIVQLLVIVNVPPFAIAVPVVLVGIVPLVVYLILL